MLNMKKFSYLKKIDAQTMGSEKLHRLRSVGELVFMAPPTLACDAPREDSVEFVPDCLCYLWL